MRKLSTTENIIGEYLKNNSSIPLFISGDINEVINQFPDESIDCIMTSPPYWGHRQYENGGIGLESTFNDYINNILNVTEILKRKLKKTGSLWLNIGDTYKSKSMQAIPWRLAIALMDSQKWILRNDIIWNKHKGGIDSSKDKLRNVHEYIFHFVKKSKYYYNDKAIRSAPRKANVIGEKIISATGVTGKNYRRYIELSTALTDIEKKEANNALDNVLRRIQCGEISDFRMIIRGKHRTTHSNSVKVSGRAKDLERKGYYFLFYNPDGTLPTDVWDIIPEDTQNRDNHYAAYPEDLCRLPILATCPPGGLVLDPFCGTGTTMLTAMTIGRKSIGIDISDEYIHLAKKRIYANH